MKRVGLHTYCFKPSVNRIRLLFFVYANNKKNGCLEPPRVGTTLRLGYTAKSNSIISLSIENVFFFPIIDCTIVKINFGLTDYYRLLRF